MENQPEHKSVESSHVSEVVEFGHVGEHVVEVVGVRRVLTLRPPEIQRIERIFLQRFFTCQELALRCQTLHSRALIHRPRCQSP